MGERLIWIVGLERAFTDDRHTMKQEFDFSRTVPAIVIGKWTVKIMSALQEKPHRHGELRRHLDGVSQRVLTRNLRNLESTGLVARQVTRSRSVAVEYSLTKLGRSFVGPLTSVCRWANHHHKELNAVVRLLEPDEVSS